MPHVRNAKQERHHGPAPKKTSLLLTNGVRLRTYYFRTTFFAANTLDASYQLISSNLLDDGALFYLNGREVGRLRLTGTPTRTSLATAQPPGGDATVAAKPPAHALHQRDWPRCSAAPTCSRWKCIRPT